MFIIALSVTGILLNHGNDLALDKTSIPKSLLGLYGIDIEPPESGFKSTNQWAVFLQEQLYLNDQMVGACTKSLAGMVESEQQLIAVCEHSIYLLTTAGSLIETDSFADDNFVKVGLSGSDIVVQGGKRLYRFDPDEFEIVPISSGNVTEVQWSISEPLPISLSNKVFDAMDIGEITWERLLLDLHSGRLFGNLGVWLVDLVGVVIILLALSGVWLRVSRPGRS